MACCTKKSQNTIGPIRIRPLSIRIITPTNQAIKGGARKIKSTLQIGEVDKHRN